MSAVNKGNNQPMSIERTEDEQQENPPEATTKYGSQDSLQGDTPDRYTENKAKLKEEILGVPKTPEAGTTPEDADTKATKYGHLIAPGAVQRIENHPEEESKHNEEPEFIAKGNYHSEVRYLERATNMDHEDAPDNLQEAWRQSVRVGVESFDREDFYGYQMAKYHEITNTIMLMDSAGLIVTVLNNFEDSVVINKDHLLDCQDPDCGRLYHRKPESPCCHWCGFSKSMGRNKTAAELLPQKGSN